MYYFRLKMYCCMCWPLQVSVKRHKKIFSKIFFESKFITFYSYNPIAINFGGIGNFIQFVINEGLKHSTQPNSQSSSDVKEQKEQNPPTNSVISQEIEPITTSEIKDNIEIKINNSNIDETIPDIINSINSIENGEILVGKKEINTN